MERFYCLVIGYIFGSFLTAELVAKLVSGKYAEDIGESGNPGMANIMANLGFGYGVIVLIGDVLKTFMAYLICRNIFSDLGYLAAYYTVLGVTIGHDYPFWHLRKGGKGVATTCAGIFFCMPFWGMLSMLVGAISVLVTQYLCIGAIVIPAVFLIVVMMFHLNEAIVVVLLLLVFSIIRNGAGILRIRQGKEKKTVLFKGKQ